uniref:SDR family NAD(P)-dependent oxidoreductase n=1 Tax=uncultured Sphingomonas sp. TaxID=158754 RepID=UPI0035C9F72B
MTTLGTALITGASTGIGAVYADRLAKRGYDLVLVARDAARLEALATRLRDETGRMVAVLPADLTARTDVAKVEARLGEGDVTLLVNNAGMSLTGNLLDSEVASVERLIALNVTAVTLLAGAAARAFAARGTGAIVNLASVLALAPEAFDGVYSGSKAFVLNLSQSLAGVLEPKGVRVQAVLPGATRTEIWERSGKDIDAFPAEMVMEVDDLVDAALAGFDAGETVTIPPLADEGLWNTLNQARLAMGPHLSRRDVAARYRAPALA